MWVSALLPGLPEPSPESCVVSTEAGRERAPFVLGQRLSNTRSKLMNWDQIQGNWKQAAGKVRETWGKITDDDFERIAGKRDQLIGMIQQRYGVAKEEAEKQVRRFEETFH
jgi:uncharacterized protein YjbJ (UPF0337 family)